MLCFQFNHLTCFLWFVSSVTCWSELYFVYFVFHSSNPQFSCLSAVAALSRHAVVIPAIFFFVLFAVSWTLLVFGGGILNFLPHALGSDWLSWPALPCFFFFFALPCLHVSQMSFIHLKLLPLKLLNCLGSARNSCMVADSLL